MLRNLLITMVLLNFTLVALAGEWSKEELELEAKKEREYAIKSQEYKRKAFEYKLFLEIAEKHYGYGRKCGNDSFLVSGFIRRLYCRAKTIITYKEVAEWIGVDIFVSGPHTNTKLDLNSKTSFGHYNIEFIRKLREKLTPLIEDEQFVFFSGKVFSKAYSTLRHHYVAYLILNEYDELKEDLLRGYSEAISQGKLGNRTNTSKSGRYNFYYFPVNDFAPELALSYKFNAAELQQDIYFWLRREMDGSSAEIFSILSDLLARYDIAFVEESECIKNRRSFYNLTNLLDKQFNHSDLNRLTISQLRVLRNSILATYGYKFKDYKLNNYFKKNAEKFCRNDKCGIVTTEYSEDHLNNIDMGNITLIKSIERNRMKK